MVALVIAGDTKEVVSVGGNVTVVETVGRLNIL